MLFEFVSCAWCNHTSLWSLSELSDIGLPLLLLLLPHCLQRLTLRVPRAVVFDEIGRAAMGNWGSGLVYGTVYLTILCEPIIFHLTCMETLRQVRLPSSS